MAELFDPEASVMAIRDALRRLRRESGMSQAQVAEGLEVVQSTPSRWESLDSGRVTTPTPRQLVRLTEFYNAPEERADLLAHRHFIDEERFPDLGSLLRQSPAVQTRVFELEQSAIQVFSYLSNAVPGIFQTEQYAAQVFRGAGIAESDIEESVRIRMSRRELLSDTSRSWTVILSKGALLWNLIGSTGMADQVRYLAEVDHPNVQLGVIDENVVVPATVMNGFEIYVGHKTEAMLGTLLGTALVSDLDPRFEAIERHRQLVHEAATYGEVARAILSEVADRYERMPS